MREIKFRVFREEITCDWGYEEDDGTFVPEIEKAHLLHDNYYKDLSDFFTYTEKERNTLMQYTGLKDKNGTDIYEGDIVKCIYRNGFYEGEVIFDNKLKRICIHLNMNKSEYVLGAQTWHHAAVKELYDLEGYDYKVIGNIYQNKDLLEL